MPPSVARLEVEVSGPKPRPWRRDGAVEVLLHDAGPDAHAPRRDVDLADRVHVARGVEHEPLAGGLPGEARAGAARDDRHVEARGGRDGGGDVGGVAREGDEQRRARVQARVAREQVAGVGVGAHLAAQLPLQLGGELRRPRLAPGVFTQEDADPYPATAMSASQRTALPPDPGAHERPGPRPAGDRRADDRPSRARTSPRLGLEVLEGLRGVFKTSGPVVVYPSSGTGAWEAALVNTLSPGDRVLAFETGHFATLWRAMAERLGLEVAVGRGRLAPRRRPRAGAAELRPRIRASRAVMVVHNETSTGVTSRIPEIRAAIDAAGHDALLLVDVISSLGSIDYRHEEWGVDVTVGGSQKGLMLPAGLGFNAVSAEGARRRRARAARRAPTGTGGRSSRPTRPASGPTRRRRTCSTGCARRSRVLREEGLVDRLRPPRAPRRGDARGGRGVGPRGAGARPARAVAGADRRRDARGLRRRRGARA